MLYEGIIHLIILVWMLSYCRRGRAPWHFFALVVCKWLCTYLCVMYIAKDAYYYEAISSYFLVDKALFRRLVFLPVKKEMLIRGLNASAIGFFYFLVRFSLTFTQQSKKTWYRACIFGINGWFLMQLLLFDPFVYNHVYQLCYPALMDAHTFHHVEQILHRTFFTGNFLLLLSSAASMLFFAARRTTLHTLRIQNLPVAIGCAVLFPFNIPLLLMLPRPLTRVSLVANGFVTYNSLPFSRTGSLYTAVMLVNCLAIVVIAFFILWRLRLARKVANDQLAITQKIDAATTTSKAFCHYMKNELLAFSAELELLTLPVEESSTALQNLQHRCDSLYTRLDEMYQSTRQGTLHLCPIRLMEPLNQVLERLHNQLQDFQVSLPEENPKLLLDREYFLLCLEDLLRNAIEASLSLPRERWRLEISVSREAGYYIIALRDHGTGIDPDVLPRLFTPFTSTKPIQKNWGISLSLVYRIIRAHGGSISMENAPGEGAVVHLLLPWLDEAEEP